MLPRSMKVDFLRACQLRGDVPTLVLRSFVRDYLSKHKVPTSLPAEDQR